MTLTLPTTPGIYGLILWLSQDCHTRIGRLGTYDFPAGWYGYWGSAHGPGGIAARVHHHLNLAARPHWHLDFLRPHGHIKAVLFEIGSDRLECPWVHQVLTFPGAQVLVHGFGSRDCRQGCPAHLIYFGTSFDLHALTKHLGNPRVIFIN